MAKKRVARRVLRKSPTSSSEGGKETAGALTSTPKSKSFIRPFFDQNLFRDPFFTEWGDIFNTPMDELFHRTEDMAKKAIRNAEKATTTNVDTSHPGSYSSRSVYRTTGCGRNPHREMINQESTTNVDENGQKFTETWKTYERDNTKRTTHAKLMGEKGVKEMRSHNYDTGEEYMHTDYKKMSEKDLNSFNNQFERGSRHARSNLISPYATTWPSFPSLATPMLPFTSNFYEPFGHPHERFGLPSSDLDFGLKRPLSSGTESTETSARSGSRR